MLAPWCDEAFSYPDTKSMKHLLISIIAFGLAVANLISAEPNRLNTAFILADDLGYADVASYGSKFYETPNIDRLAA